MKEKVLVIIRDANEQRIPLKKERIVIGRDTECDIVWNEQEFSREHVVIHYKHENIYIENVSTSGTVKINKKDVEYAELHEGTEVIIGPYLLKWIYANVVEKLEKENSGVVSQPDIKAFDDASSSKILGEKSGATNPSIGDLPLLESTIQADSGDIQMSPEIAAAIAEDDTVTQLQAAVGLIRIVSGEIAGREIRLEHGKEWIVGRARECHVSIDNPKMSRHHFKIIQIGGGFRIQDLDSSYGVKINGVSVKDAPIKSFDNLTAGPVEMQFVIVDKNLKDIQDLPMNITAAMNAGGGLPAVIRDEAPRNNMNSERTNWAPAVNNAPPMGSFQFSKPSLENSNSQGNFVSVADPKKGVPLKDRILNISQNFKKMPTSRKVLIVAVIFLGIAAIAMSLLPEEKAPVVATKKEEGKDKKDETPEEDNPAESAEYSPEYQLKSPKEKIEIQTLYAQADEARNKGEWQKAHDLAQDIVKRVGKYKRTAEIIAEAQGYLTDLQIATLSRADADADSAAANNKQKVEELLTQGEKAMNEKRWDDAQEIYSKALLLDPKNEKATRGQFAAQAKDVAALNKELPIERDPAAAQKAQEAAKAASSSSAQDESSMETMSTQYQAAKQKIQEGAFREAMPMLTDLKEKIEQSIAEDESTRAPAGAIAEDKRNMRAKIIESLDTINDQFVLEYKTQMDDAQQAIANQKYVEARAIYDTVIKREPMFEEPKIEREKLYKKMMTDGQSAYREGLVSESVGDLSTALEMYEKAKSYFESIDKKDAQEYFAILDKKLRVLKK